MKPIKTVLACLFAASLWACAADDPAALMASAKQYMAKRDFNSSVIQLKNVLQQHPENAEARYLLALAALEQGDLASAQIELEKAAQFGMASDPLEVARARTALAGNDFQKVVNEYGSKTLAEPGAQAELRALVGSAHLARNQRTEAAIAFEQALALDGTNLRAHLGNARLAATEQRLADALSHVEQALATDATSAQALLFKADLLSMQGQADAAEHAYRAAIQSSPNSVPPRSALITHLLRQRKVEAAAAEATALEKAAPKDARSAFARALVLVDQRQYAAAKAPLQQVLKATPEHVPGLVLAGMVALQTGAVHEAESHLRRATANAPQSLVARRLLAATHLRMGRTQLALNEVDQLLKLTQDASTVALAGEVYLANGDVAGAQKHYERAKSLAPKNAALQTRLAMIRFAAGDAERAITELETASASDPSVHQADLALITAHLRRREADRALEAIAALEKKQPNNPLTHNLRGGALILKNDLSGARASFEQALKLQPTNMAAVRNLAQLDMHEKKPAAARKRYEAVLKKDPNNEQALVGLAALLRATGANSVAVEKLLKQSVSANPASPRARVSLINFYLRNQDFKAALAAAQAAHAALPSHPAVVQALGMTQMAAGETRQAIASFTRLAEMLPKSPEPQIHLARAHLAAKQPDPAIKALRAALALRPDLVSAQRDIAAVYVSSGRHDEALREAKAVQAAQPEAPLGYVLEGEVYLAQKKLDAAERIYRAALKKFDVPVLAMRTHAVLNAAGKAPQAAALVEDWIKRHPKDAAVLAYLGEQELAAKRYESASRHYQEALERQPDNPMFLNNLAWAANQLKQPQAIEYAERASELAPNNPAVMDTLGWILVGNGQTERGLELLGRAAELAPGAYPIRLNFAKALLKAERQAAARKELESLAKLDSRLPVQQEAAKLLGALK